MRIREQISLPFLSISKDVAGTVSNRLDELQFQGTTSLTQFLKFKITEDNILSSKALVESMIGYHLS